jgi:glycosyltransferase involved in cell wall biosynthesis
MRHAMVYAAAAESRVRVRLENPSRGSLHVGVDARCLNARRPWGGGNYLTGIVSKLARSGEVDWSFFSDRPDLPFHTPPDAGDRPVYLFDCPGQRLQIWEQVVLPAQARYHGVDVLHCPFNSLPLWQPVPIVVTLHDTIEWDVDALPHGLYMDRVLPRAFARCMAVVTPSNHSRDDILRRWPGMSDKLFVVPHGIDQRFLDIAPEQLTPDLLAQGVREPYLVYFGGESARKRLDWTIDTFEAIEDPEALLVICGLPGERHADFMAKLRPETRDRVRLLPYIPTDSMARLFQNAAAILYPTLYEGFGFPALEAQAVGTPVLFSPVSSLRELSGPSARLLDPDDRRSWIELCGKLIAQYREGRTPDVNARRWAECFSWEEAAQRHLRVYEAAARGRTQAWGGWRRAG